MRLDKLKQVNPNGTYVNSFKLMFDSSLSLILNYLSLMIFSLSLSLFILSKFKLQHLDIQLNLTHLHPYS